MCAMLFFIYLQQVAKRLFKSDYSRAEIDFPAPKPIFNSKYY